MEPHSFPILESGVFLFSDPSQSSLHSPHKDIDAKSGRTGTRIAPPGGGECTGGGQRDRADGSCGGHRKLCVPSYFVCRNPSWDRCQTGVRGSTRQNGTKERDMWSRCTVVKAGKRGSNPRPERSPSKAPPTRHPHRNTTEP